MNISDRTLEQKLELLVQERESKQISQYRFEQEKRKLLGEPLAGQSNHVRDIILAGVIGIAALLGLALTYPTEAKVFATVSWHLVKIDTRNPVEKYQDFKESSDGMADHMFAPANQLLER